MQVICDYCGNIIAPTWRDYLKSYNGSYACQKCRQKKTSEQTLKDRQENLYNRALEYCNEMGYKLLSKKEDIESVYSYVEFECPIHGKQLKKLVGMVYKYNGRNVGCILCGREKTRRFSQLDLDYVDSKITEYGGIWLNKKDYTGWADKNLKIVCPSCNKPFITSYNSFVKHGGQFCPECSSKESNGEKKIRLYLEKNNIPFIQEYRFLDCKDKNTLPFDFYIPYQNKVIEFQGAQHYQCIDKFGDEKDFAIRKRHDELKKQYCKENNIYLIEIPYTDIKNIDIILQQELAI